MGASEHSIPRMLIFAGCVLIVVGLIWWLAPGRLNWLGRLPGDIRVERENFRFYFPITTMLLISLVLNLILRLVRWFSGHA